MTEVAPKTQRDQVQESLDSHHHYNNTEQTEKFTVLNILVWNIRGINDKVFDEDMQEFMFKNDIILLTETHTEKLSEKKYNTIPHFVYKDFPRKSPNAPGPSGGIGIYIRAELAEGIELLSTDESIVWLRLRSSFFAWERDKLIACIYFSPKDSTYIHSTNVRTDYFSILSEQLAKYNMEDDIILCGDFNSRTGNLVDHYEHIPGTEGELERLAHTSVISHDSRLRGKRFSQDSSINEYGRELLHICKSTGLSIMNGRIGKIENTGDFTCYKEKGASVVDYLMCKPNVMSCIRDFRILPKRVESDHRALSFTLDVPGVINAQTNTAGSTGKRLSCFKWDTSKVNTYRDKLKGASFINMHEQLTLDVIDPCVKSDELCNMFHGTMNDIIGNVFKTKKHVNRVQFPKNKWFDEECKTLKHEINNYAKTHNISRSPFSEQYHALELDYKRLKQKKKRDHQNQIRDKLETFQSNSPAAYWKFWKSLKPKEINNSKLSLNEFDTYFKNQIEPPSTHYFDHEFMEKIMEFVNHYRGSTHEIETHIITENISMTDEICNSPITLDEINTHIRKLKNNKAAGIDGVSGEFIKYACDELNTTLHVLFNSIFDRGDWPTKWAEGIISPVHKKESVNVADNYRKITVMPTLGKILESILNSRLVFRNIVLCQDDPYQFGFKQNSRTTDNVFILHSIINRQKFKNKPLYVCFVDFSKAFDYVNRYALYYKLIRRGITGKLLNLICDMYDKSVCHVKWKGEVGEQIDSKYGVLQGGMLSPKLFTEFLSDLKEELEDKHGLLLNDSILSYILYADDLVLCSESPDGLQNLIDGLFTFCKKWHLIVSLAKTNVLVFGKKKVETQFMFNKKKIEIITEYKYLGTIITTATNDMFAKNLDHLTGKVRNALFALDCYIQHSINYLQPSLAMKMFDTQIVPILEYMSEIWYKNKVLSDMEKIHLKYIKTSLRVKPSSSTWAVYAECGRFPLKIKIQVQLIKYWKRILRLNDDSIAKNAYKSLYDLHGMGQENWCTHVQNILNEAGMQSVWVEQYISDRDLAILKETLYKSYMDKCLANICDSENNPKLRTYKLFKNEFKLEKYLTHAYNINYTVALTRFRISSHNLRIETGRYTKPNKTPVDERICLYCSSQTIEDELHFILECDLYTDERSRLLQISYDSIPGFIYMTKEDKFISMMSSNETAMVKQLGKYLHDCFKKRSDIDTQV